MLPVRKMMPVLKQKILFRDGAIFVEKSGLLA